MALLLTLKPPLTPPHLHHHHHTTTLFSPKLKPKHSHFKPHFSSSFKNNQTPPETNCPVPQDQQPINEYQSLSTSSPFSWASGDFVEYCSKLIVVGIGFGLFVVLPVSWYGSVGVGWELGQRVLGGVCSGLFVVTGVVVRMYLGWAYVGNRLLSATVECTYELGGRKAYTPSVPYEETGWYDGQLWVKTAEVLARDRLLGSFTVKPVLNRLKNTLVALAISLFVSIALLINTESSQKESYITSGVEEGGRSVAGVYNDESARSFEPEAFCGGSGPSMDD